MLMLPNEQHQSTEGHNLYTNAVDKSDHQNIYFL